MEQYIYGNQFASDVLVQMVADHSMDTLEREAALIREQTGRDFCLLAFNVGSWNDELSPWEAPAVFGNEAFGSGAAATLEEILKFCADPVKTYYIGGYSLAGLFALWAAYQTDVFAGVAAASPSVWFPGFAAYMRGREIRSEAVYLSLGDREERTRNPVMAKVGDCIREAESLLKASGTDCVLEWNPGNHFKDADLRTAKAFAWLLNRKDGKQ